MCTASIFTRATRRPIRFAASSDPPMANTDCPNRVRLSRTEPAAKTASAITTGMPTPNQRPWPRFFIHRSWSIRYVVLPLSDTLNARPRANNNPASVMMNGGMPSRPINVPWTRPSTPQTTSGSTMPTNDPHCDPYAASTAASAYIEPTDRSIPPLMMTNVMPIATIARNDDEDREVGEVRGGGELRAEQTITPTSTTTASTTAAADRWISDVTDPPRRRAATSSSGPSSGRAWLVSAVIGAGPVGCRRRRR